MNTVVCRRCGTLFYTSERRKAICRECGAANVVPQEAVETKPGPGSTVVRTTLAQARRAGQEEIAARAAGR